MADAAESIRETHGRLVELLKSRRNSAGYWEGHLSSSALSTAVAAFALWKHDAQAHEEKVRAALEWLADNANEDGGWGDTTRSRSNLSTTLLCWSAFAAAEDEVFAETVARAEQWIARRTGSLEPDTIATAVLKHYGADRTFAAPILTMCAMAGRLGPGGWARVPQLPLELALLPDWLFKVIKLSVVSYAVPALIAVGMVRHRRRPSRNVIMRFIRWLGAPRLMRKLSVRQPEKGGFLEAAPLTAFVLMSLVESGEGRHEVARRAASFLAGTVREDGSWPIDTNLATWVTTLSVRALGSDLDDRQREAVRTWLLAQQHSRVHPFTGAAPGGWAWTDLPGGVPDADDTAGALHALLQLAPAHRSLDAAERGITWLLDLQNSDGGLPTFCRGWGKLPFDRSCPDITANALSAMAAWKPHVHEPVQVRIDKAISRGAGYLKNAQGPAGQWQPLWFGNEADAEHRNLVYGTSIVVRNLCEMRRGGTQRLDDLIDGGLMFLRAAQNGDGGWGGNRDLPSSVEETSLAISAFVAAGKRRDTPGGVNWLLERLGRIDNPSDTAAPIGLYFASLWYYEELYPIIFACGALGSV